MVQTDIQRLQNLILSIAEEVIRICEKHGINYYLSDGSLLGAVRHKGFIPWDDDMDIAMKRNDYNRFLELCEQEIDKQKYFIQTESSEEQYCFAFAKIQLKGTEIIEDFSKNVKIQHGIFLDIFPYDNLPDKKWKRKWMLWKNRLLKNMIWVRCGYGTEQQKRTIIYKVFRLLGMFFSIRFLKKMRYKLITKYNGKMSKYCFSSDYPDIPLRNSWFDDSSDYEFEHRQFTSFSQYDIILKKLYGDYMKLPEECDRQQHSIGEIDFGIYGNQRSDGI